MSLAPRDHLNRKVTASGVSGRGAGRRRRTAPGGVGVGCAGKPRRRCSARARLGKRRRNRKPANERRLVMAQKVSDIMTTALVMIRPSQSVTDAARAMRDNGIGAVLVADNGELLGIASDRDIVVRAVADGKDPARTPVAEVCSADVVTATPSEDAGEAVRRMREHGVRRIPVVEGGNRPVGILSIGDMAIERDEGSALADISVQTPNT